MTRARAAYIVAGLAFAAYPAVRPWGPETGADGAADFASPAWLVAHVLGMVGFVSLTLGLRAAGLRSHETTSWLAVALLLPYYGAEAYGLNAVGRYVVDTGDVSVLEVADSFRLAPFEATSFAVGLVLLAVVGLRLARTLWVTGGVGRLGGVLAGAGLVTYLPQFFTTAEVRVGHGAVLGLGLLLVAAAGRSERDERVSAEPALAR